jgi:hypothetical protein
MARHASRHSGCSGLERVQLELGLADWVALSHWWVPVPGDADAPGLPLALGLGLAAKTVVTPQVASAPTKTSAPTATLALLRGPRRGRCSGGGCSIGSMGKLLCLWAG